MCQSLPHSVPHPCFPTLSLTHSHPPSLPPLPLFSPSLTLPPVANHSHFITTYTPSLTIPRAPSSLILHPGHPHHIIFFLFGIYFFFSLFLRSLFNCHFSHFYPCDRDLPSGFQRLESVNGREDISRLAAICLFRTVCALPAMVHTQRTCTRTYAHTQMGSKP